MVILILMINLSWILWMMFDIYPYDLTLHEYNSTTNLHSLKHETLMGKLKDKIQALYLRREIEWISKYGIVLLIFYMASFMFNISNFNAYRYFFFGLYVLMALAPIFNFNYRKNKVSTHIEQNILSFLQLLYAGYLQSGDVLQAIQYCSQHVSNPILKERLVQFNFNIQKGLNPSVAFEQLRNNSMHDYFAYIILNIEQSYERRGNTLELIHGLQMEYSSIRIELNKRQIELKQERTLLMICTIVFWGVWYYMYKTNSYLWSFYTDNHLAVYIVATLITTFAITLFILFKGDKLKY